MLRHFQDPYEKISEKNKKEIKNNANDSYKNHILSGNLRKVIEHTHNNQSRGANIYYQGRQIFGSAVRYPIFFIQHKTSEDQNKNHHHLLQHYQTAHFPLFLFSSFFFCGLGQKA